MAAVIPAVTMIASLAGGAISAYSQVREGQAAAEAERYNAQVYRQQAEMTARSGALEAERQRTQARKLMSRQSALYAKSGVTLSGSPLSVMIDSAAEAEMDTLITEYNTKVGVQKAQSAATYSEEKAGIYERTGWLKAGNTLLTTAGNFGVSNYGYGLSKPKSYGVASGG